MTGAEQKEERSRPLRVAIFSSMPKEMYSGGRYHALMMAETLAYGGHEVVIVTNNKPVFYDDFSLLPAHESIHLCVQKDFSTNLPDGEFDVVVFVPGLEMDHDYLYGPQRFALERKAHLVFLNFESPNWYNSLSPVSRGEEIWNPWKRLCRRASLILSLTREGNTWAKDFYDVCPEFTRFDWCYPAINTATADQVADGPKERRIVFFARFLFSEHKGEEQLHKVFCEAMRGYEFVILAGKPRIDPKDLQDLQQAAERFGVKVTVKCVASDKEKFEELKKASLLLFPSYFEGFGYPPIEAQYCGTPTVAFDLPVLRETSGDGIIYAAHGDWDDLSAKVREVLRSDRAFGRLQEHARSIASLEVQRDRLNELLLPLRDVKPPRADGGEGSTLIYLGPQSQYLAERWLRHRTEKEEVVVATERDMIDSAIEIQAEFGNVREIIVLPEETPFLSDREAVELDRLKELAFNEAILPSPVTLKELMFVPGIPAPDVTPLFGTMRRMWFVGCRRFGLFNLGGIQWFEVPHLLDELHGKHKGKRCFVVGNGPSLNKIDMSLLKDEITLGANRCYLGYEKWGYQFTYWGIVDRLQIEEYTSEYEDNIPDDTIKFFPFEYLPVFQVENACPLNFNFSAKPPNNFSDRPEVIHLGNTVTHTHLQLAAVMGCNPIILIGVDHRYNLPGEDKNDSGSRRKADKAETRKRLHHRSWKKRFYEKVTRLLPKPVKLRIDRFIGTNRPKVSPTLKPVAKLKDKDLWVAGDASKPTHFTDAYTGGTKRFVVPRPERAEASFDAAAEWARKNGVHILNATPGSALDSFPLVEYESLFPVSEDPTDLEKIHFLTPYDAPRCDLETKASVSPPKFIHVGSCPVMVLAGWYVSGRRELVAATINDRNCDSEMQSRPDLDEKFGNYPVRQGFKVQVETKRLRASNHVEVRVGEKVCFSQIVNVE